MIDRMSEYAGIDANELRSGIAVASALIASILITLFIIGGWVAAVLYWIIPLSLDTGSGLGFMRGFLAIGGATMIGVAYLLGLFAITTNA